VNTTDEFWHNLEHLDKDLTIVNESLSLKATMKYNNVLLKKKEEIEQKIKQRIREAFHKAFIVSKAKRLPTINHN